jgi:hypothetical protein
MVTLSDSFVTHKVRAHLVVQFDTINPSSDYLLYLFAPFCIEAPHCQSPNTLYYMLSQNLI